MIPAQAGCAIAGYALCLDDIGNTAGGSTLCFRPPEPALASQVNLVWKKHQTFSKPSELFLDQISSRKLSP